MEGLRKRLYPIVEDTSEKTSSTMEDFPKDKILKCCTCDRFPCAIFPVQICEAPENSHIFCGLCKPNKLVMCSLPDCRYNIRDSHTVDKFIRAQKHHLYCPYSAEGCGKLVPVTKMKEHMEFLCEYRPVPCPLRTQVGVSCGEKRIRLIDLYRHLKRVHKVATVTKGGLDHPEWTASTVQYMKGIRKDQPIILMAIDFHNQIFLRHARFTMGRFYQWVSVIGDEKLAKKYRFKITMNSTITSMSVNEETSSSVAWELPVVPIHDSNFYDIDRDKIVVNKNGTTRVIRVDGNMSQKSFEDFCKTGIDPLTKKEYNYVWTDTFKIANVAVSPAALALVMLNHTSLKANDDSFHLSV